MLRTKERLPRHEVGSEHEEYENHRLSDVFTDFSRFL
jgi:hypothetical protein